MKARVGLVFLLFVVFISGCQNFFTYSPLDILQRDPDSLSKEQQLVYARQALSSGKKGPMEDALDIVTNDLIPDDPTNADLYLLEADLLWTLSDAPDAILGYLNDNSQTFPDWTDPLLFPAFVNDVIGRLTPEEVLVFQFAATIYYNADVDLIIDASLNPIQELAAGIGLLSTGVPALFLIANAYIADAISILAID